MSVEVFAASSLADVPGDLAESFEAAHPDVDVRVTSAGSQVLRLQIEEGAPADLFASADPSHARLLWEAGLLGSPEVLAHNALVAVVPDASPLRTFDDLPRATRIVVGTPNVPVGAYTRQVLQRARTVRGDAFAEAIAGSIVSEEPNVRLVRAKVELGEADAAFVYRTDVSPGLRALPLPEALAVRATHVVALRPEASREAQAFFAWALGPTGDAALLDHGFDP
ncbi:MAG: molybdate ABC transporter substrate-binding protein [Alphaproteobacteria bacterium]|nr:molybdate ABC transporter substrate-binding protein [Alphaproteobacteria bacterium]